MHQAKIIHHKNHTNLSGISNIGGKERFDLVSFSTARMAKNCSLLLGGKLQHTSVKG
jgi:hypothetical protein